MTTTSLRLSEDDEKRLSRIRKATGWTASEALKRGLKAIEAELAEKPAKTAWEIYRELDLGPGEPGEPAHDRASRSRELVREAIREKHRRRSSVRK